MFFSWGVILSANVEDSPSNMLEFNLFLIACPFSLVIHLFELISVICPNYEVFCNIYSKL